MEYQINIELRGTFTIAFSMLSNDAQLLEISKIEALADILVFSANRLGCTELERGLIVNKALQDCKTLNAKSLLVLNLALHSYLNRLTLLM